MSETPATDTLSLVVEAIAWPFQRSRAAKANLDYAALNGTLEVSWSLSRPIEGYVPLDDDTPDWFSQAVDSSYPPCWDGCNGISTVHRGGWCRRNPDHQDFDCGCDEPPEPEGWGEDEPTLTEKLRANLEAAGIALEDAPELTRYLLDTDDEEPF